MLPSIASDGRGCSLHHMRNQVFFQTSLLTGALMALTVACARPAEERAYLDALEEMEATEWASDEDAVLAGRDFCDQLESGELALGSQFDEIAVEHLCAAHLDAFLAHQGYLDKIRREDLDEWATDRAAINAGYRVCERLDNGEPARGSLTDQIAVEHLCPDYRVGFRTLEQSRIRGSFTVIDSDFRGRRSGRSCSPSGGYSDINRSTQVVVRNTEDMELGRADLGAGTISSLGCKFSFSLTLTEGEDLYLVTVGRRGEIAYTWEELRRPNAIDLTLGD